MKRMEPSHMKASTETVEARRMNWILKSHINWKGSKVTQIESDEEINKAFLYLSNLFLKKEQFINALH